MQLHTLQHKLYTASIHLHRQLLRNEALNGGRSGELRHVLSDAESQFAAMRQGEEESNLRRLPRTLSPGELTADLQGSRNNSLQSDQLGSTRLDSVPTPPEVEGSRATLLTSGSGGEGREEGAPPRGFAGVKKAVVGVKKRVAQLAATPRDDAQLQPHSTI